MTAAREALDAIRAHVAMVTGEGVCPISRHGCGAALDQGMSHHETCVIGMLARLLEEITNLTGANDVLGDELDTQRERAEAAEAARDAAEAEAGRLRRAVQACVDNEHWPIDGVRSWLRAALAPERAHE